MTQEDKQLLLKDLSARLFYGVYIENAFYSSFGEVIKVKEQLNPEHLTILYNDIYNDENWHSNIFKPYLRPMSSMTEKEKKMVCSMNGLSDTELNDRTEYPNIYVKNYTIETFDYFNEHHLDYRGLIPMGLASEAKEGMYKTDQL